MNISNCKRCRAMTYDGQTVLGHPHVCPPQWVVWCGENGETRTEIEEDGRRVFACDARAAAIKWAEHYDRDEHYLTHGPSLVIEVVRPGHADVTRWRVYGELVPQYNAHPEAAAEDKAAARAGAARDAEETP